MSWYYYLEGKISFPFQARCVAANAVSPLRKGATVEFLRTVVEDACEHDVFVQIRWQGRKVAIPLSQLRAPRSRRINQRSHSRLALLGRAELLIYARLPESSPNIRVSKFCRQYRFQPCATAARQWLAFSPLLPTEDRISPTPCRTPPSPLKLGIE